MEYILCFRSIMINMILIWWLFFRIHSVLSEEVEVDEYFDIIAGKVEEKLDSLLNQPQFDLEVFDHYYSFKGFPHDLQAPDRELALKYIYSSMKSHKDARLVIYYGLENGMHLGYVYSGINADLPYLTYKEPGNSGYPIIDDNPEKNLYFKTCVDSKTGELQNCTMKAGDKYISCIDSCNLIPCNDTESQSMNCSSYELESTGLAECESKIKWCEKYEIKSAEENENMGYIPLTMHCYDSEGAISNTPGGVMISSSDGTIAPGNCIYGSGSGHLVARQISGPFAQCEFFERSECDTTFIGGYSSSNYDPRYRGWYKLAKETQKPGFSEIYLYYNSNVMGVTYSHPIYTKRENKKVFYGVLAADLALDDISLFLGNITYNTNYLYCICEDNPPHKMIGISTGSQLTRQECAINNKTRNEECTNLPLTIAEIGNNGKKEDMMLREAHAILYSDGYVTDKLEIFDEVDEEVNPMLYIGSSQMYVKSEHNIKWRLVTVFPLEITGYDSLTKDDIGFFMAIVIAVSGFVICLTLFALLYQKKKFRAVQLADFQLTSAFVIGCAMINLSSLCYLGERTDALCAMTMWIPLMLLSTTLSIVLVKIYRLYVLVGTANSNRLSNRQAWLYILSIPLIEFVTLLSFGLADPFKATFTIHLDTKRSQGIACVMIHGRVFAAIHAIYFFFLIFFGCFVTYLIRNIDSKFEDVRALLFSMYNIVFISFIYVLIIFSVGGLDDENKYLIRTVCLFMVTVSSSTRFIIPRLIAAKREQQAEHEIMQNLYMDSIKNAQNNMHKYAADASRDSIHLSDTTFKVLICSSNMGNAAPTLSSMKAWIPEGGYCDKVQPLDQEQIVASKFHLIVIGMQEARWITTEKKEEQNDPDAKDEDNQISCNDEDSSLLTRSKRKASRLVSTRLSMTHDEMNYLSAVEGEDTIALRNMEETLLGTDYLPIAQETRGQMRLHVYAYNRVAPLIKNIKFSGTNTGIGNVMANKGGIVVSFEYMRTKFTFLTAHLAAHEGKPYFQARCNNIQDILRFSKTFDLSKIADLSVASHHMFIFGDLNFRTNFQSKDIDDESKLLSSSAFTSTSYEDTNDIGDESTMLTTVAGYNNDMIDDSTYLAEKDDLDDASGESTNLVIGEDSNDEINKLTTSFNDPKNKVAKKQTNLEQAIKLIDNKDWASLYSNDELSEGLANGTLLVDFQTLPCHFNPTFKVKRSAGFEYNQQRTPSYTDRILYKSAKGLQSHNKQVAYEPCVDFITSDHKPIRGAFSIILNEMIEALTLPNEFQLIFTGLQCSDLLAANVDGSSNPYAMIVWDSISLKTTFRKHFKFSDKKLHNERRWPTTCHKKRTLNPKWVNTKLILDSTSCEVNCEAAIYLLVFDYDVLRDDDFLGALCLSVQEVVSMVDEKQSCIDRPLEHYGKHAGRIKFNLQLKLKTEI